MKKNILVFILLLLSLSLISACSKSKGEVNDDSESENVGKLDLVDTEDKEKDQTEITEETMEPIITKIQDSAYKGLNVTFESYIDEKMEYSYFIPEIQSKELDEEVGNWLKGEKESFIKEAESISKSTNNNWVSNFNSLLTTQQIDEENMIYSLFFQESVILAGSNIMEKNKGFTFNIKENRMYKFTDLVNIPEDKLSDAIYKNLGGSSELLKYIDQEVLNESLSKQDNIDFRIYNDEIHILFDSYEIVSGNFGALEVALKDEDIKEYLSEDGKKLLSIEDETETSEEISEEKDKVNDSEITEDKTEKSSLPNAQSGYVALTFDDGPHQTNTPRLLDILDNYGIKATFYILGQNAEYYPGIVKDIANRGHELGNHSYSHPNLTNLGYEGSLEELQHNDNILLEICGKRAATVRPPYGAIDESVEAAILDNGQRVITWNLDTEDWKNRDPDIILQRVIESVEPGSIILMHDIHETSVDAVPRVIEYLTNEGYQLVTISQLP